MSAGSEEGASNSASTAAADRRSRRRAAFVAGLIPCIVAPWIFLRLSPPSGVGEFLFGTLFGGCILMQGPFTWLSPRPKGVMMMFTLGPSLAGCWFTLVLLTKLGDVRWIVHFVLSCAWVTSAILRIAAMMAAA